MSHDISRILAEWPYDPDRMSVRIIRGDDDRSKVQLRLDLGLLQMEIDGRPDGQRPEGYESWLDYYEDQCRKHEADPTETTAFELDEQACDRLWYEGLQYYHRYLSFWYLERYDLCARDTARNLRLFAFVRKYAWNDEYKWRFDRWRPYVIMVNTRAVAIPQVAQEEYAEAMATIDKGIEAIGQFLQDYDQLESADECEELVELRQLRRRVDEQLRRAAAARRETPVERLERQLRQAIRTEAFEEAARIRDAIRRLTEPGQS